MSFLQNIDPEMLEIKYLAWKRDSSSMSAEWQRFFEGFDLAMAPIPSGSHPDLPEALLQSSVQSLIYRYRDIGHILACTDPLSPCPVSHPLLDLAAFGLNEEHFSSHFHIKDYVKSTATLGEIWENMRQTYCGSIGVEFMYIPDPEERQWLIDRMEPIGNQPSPGLEQKTRILSKLQQGTLFEEFLHRRYIGQKRFSLEGGEALLVALDAIVASGSGAGLSRMIIGMSHRGRLNTLANIIGKPLAAMFAEFDESDIEGVSGEGDVKYHKGYSADVARLHLTLAYNPSHLEAVNPVVEGECRGWQDLIGAEGAKMVLPLLIHGDAAFAGQGVVAETLNLSRLEGTATGGTIHIVVNNQIGFTTLPEDSRSTRYATDVARMLMIPVFHVNGDDPESVELVARRALEYRQQFGRDVVIEIICYRRHGHNEGDEPGFTQPVMYGQIRQRRPLHLDYGDQLIAEGIPPEVVSAMAKAYSDALLKAASGGIPHFQPGSDIPPRRRLSTEAVKPSLEGLERLNRSITTLPDNFNPHAKMVQLYRKRNETFTGGGLIDWGGAEALAIGSLLNSGVWVRIMGQDSRRGTFNHRHAVLHDLNSGQRHTPLEAAQADGARFFVFDSMLSEYAVLGFEYGYSLARPDSLVIWEAQFGDFVNGAQVMIDQFIASGESKWGLASPLVMLLPHGYEGSGAEHSSARIERFLSLCAEENIRVATPSTPAQIYHLLRWQAVDPVRKPLVVFTPKSLLRNQICASRPSELAEGSFEPLIADRVVDAATERVIICSGKIYYELAAERQRLGADSVAIIRVEFLYPLATEMLKGMLAGMPGNARLIYAQEEPENMGAWPMLKGEIAAATGREAKFVGRKASAAPATGLHKVHDEEQKGIVGGAFNGYK